MTLLLFSVYLILFTWLVTITPFFKRSGLSRSQLILFFLIKVIICILYGCVGIYFNGLVDTWEFHFMALRSYQILQLDPGYYFKDLFQNGYGSGYGNFFSSYNSWWNDLHNNAFTLLLSLLNFLSFGNYFINGIFFSFLAFFGPVALYKVMNDALPGNKTIILLVSFLLPSFVYWHSGLHKDGIIFCALMLIIYNFYFALKGGVFSLQKIALILLGFLLLLALRNYLLLIFLPALLAWYLAAAIKRRPALIFFTVYLGSAILFFSLRYLTTKLDFPQAVVEKQKSFWTLVGRSPIPVKALKPTVAGFAQNAPEALSIVLLRPYPTDVKDAFSLLACAETLFFLALFLLFVFFRKRSEANYQFLLFCLFFSLSVLLTIGYTVNFLGAIVRYRSIVLPFLILPLLALTDWQKIKAKSKK